MNASPAAESIRFSLVRGGPFHALLRRMIPRREDGRDVLRQSLALLALTYGPLLVIAAVERLVRGRWDPLLRDSGVHARLLVALPLLLLSGEQLHRASGLCVERFVRGGFACDGEAAVQPIVARAERLRDSRVGELVLLGAALLAGLMAFWSQSSGIVHTSIVLERRPSELWYGLVVLPFVVFLFGRWLWRWIIWSELLWRLSRIELRLIAMHPDRQGGIAFLSEPALALAPGFAAFSAVQAGTWATRIALEGTSVHAFTGPIVGILVGALLLAFGPLVVWSPLLWRTYLQGETDYSLFAGEYVRRFHDKWIEERSGGEVLGTPDIQSLADIGNSFAALHNMRLFLFDARWVALVAASTISPIIPLVLNELPLSEILRKVILA